MNEPNWARVEAVLRVAIDLGKEQLESRGMDQRDADFTRGMLAAYREILLLPETTAASRGDFEDATPYALR